MSKGQGIRRIHLVGGLIISVLVVASAVLAFTTAANFVGQTGAPGEGTCQTCHTTFPINTGDGELKISLDRTYFLPGETVNLRVDLNETGRRIWSFQMTVLDRDEQPHGKFRVVDPTFTRAPTDIIAGRQYAEPTPAGNYPGVVDSSPGWVFQWVAPLTIDGPAFFYAAGCAGNLDTTEALDNIHSTKAVLPMAASACCTPARDYIDCNTGVDISDLTILVDNLFGTFTPVCCEAAADLDNNSSIDIADLTKLIDHLFVSFDPLDACS